MGVKNLEKKIYHLPCAIFFCMLAILFIAFPSYARVCYGDSPDGQDFSSFLNVARKEIRENPNKYQYGGAKFFAIRRNSLDIGWIYGVFHSTYPLVHYVDRKIITAILEANFVLTEESVEELMTVDFTTMLRSIPQSFDGKKIPDIIVDGMLNANDGEMQVNLQKLGLPDSILREKTPREIQTMMLNIGCVSEMMKILRKALVPEELIQSWAIVFGKPIESLEPLSDSAGLLISESYINTLTKLLPLYVRRADTATSLLNFRLLAYATGRIDIVDAIHNSYLVDADDKVPLLNQNINLVYERNKKFVVKIQEAITNNRRPLIVLGAGHLLGEDGIINLLKGKNMEIVPIKLDLENFLTVKFPDFGR